MTFIKVLLLLMIYLLAHTFCVGKRGKVAGQISGRIAAPYFLPRELEDALDIKTAQLITLRKAATAALARWAGSGDPEDVTLQAALRAVPADARCASTH